MKWNWRYFANATVYATAAVLCYHFVWKDWFLPYLLGLLAIAGPQLFSTEENN